MMCEGRLGRKEERQREREKKRDEERKRAEETKPAQHISEPEPGGG